jgi:tripartite-type tricarboxylate transporter receptor subunit TctC
MARARLLRPLLDAPRATALTVGLRVTSWFAIDAPAQTSAATIAQINTAVNKAWAAPELRERFAKLGLEVTGGSAADLLAISKRDSERWAPAVKASGFRGD